MRFSASKLRIDSDGTEVNIYWSTEMDLGGGLVPTYARILLKNFTVNVVTDYKDISGMVCYWANSGENVRS
ncbi:hypothetical protein MASR2M78_21350 [Treponema sp.]